ncbi:uncharacterized protein H6S33_011513 [Morchella sextelata]|uniref:uncharacterized protein n=1 Tax=Morchella sextelata TaxID=1174677 RepID=UPI001D0363C3|nr:uncharacterized protein H6S33_011513 [Morchella sextelata]KAH0611086.1 hypothetical protein H6S33_011513 [Morchella sextelata]
MPSYFFHLFFDLHSPTSHIARSLPELSELSVTQLSSLLAWIPPPGTNIFATTLPPHPPPIASDKKEVSKLIAPQAETSRNKAKETQSTEIPPPSTHEQLDWRFGKIAVESIDMGSEEAPVSGVQSGPAQRRKSSAASAPLAGGTAAKAHFVPLESRNTEFGYGVVHLYRDVLETPGLYTADLKKKGKEDTGELIEEEDDDALTTVAILAVPSYMTPSDFMGFVGEETRDTVSHFRMIRTGKANRYMVLMKFRHKEDAKVFVTEFNGKVFNSMEPENCHVVFIKSIQFQKPSSNNQASSVAFPEISNDPFFPSQGPRPAIPAVAASSLICGNLGCGRYDDAHAFEHYKETSHCYAMDIETQRVWDYVGDGYVHRLIQNKADGKLVELPSALSVSQNPDSPGNGGDYVPREKLDNIGMEYTYLLTSQLDSQRLYFEEKVAQAADKASEAAHAAEKAVAESREFMKELKELKLKHSEVTQELLPLAERGKERAERKAEKFGEMARRMEKEWKEEKGVNSGLMEKIQYLTKESEERKKENEDLKEQIRDLMFFLETREKMENQGEEIVEGTVTVGDAPPPPRNKKKGRGKR